MPKRKLWQALAVAVLAVVMLGADGSGGTDVARFGKLGHMMVCQCGCGQILVECNHVGCPVSPVMLQELRAQLASGAADTPVLNWFTAKYGAVVLAAPIRGGFDTVAWIMPLAVFLLGTVGTALLVRTWVRRRGGGPLLTTASADHMEYTPEQRAMRDRIRQETEY